MELWLQPVLYRVCDLSALYTVEEMEMKKSNLSLSACVLIVLSMLLVGCVPQAPGAVETSGTVELELMIAPEGVFGDITPET